MSNDELDLPTALAAFFGRPIEVGPRAADALSQFGSVRRLWKRELIVRGDLEIFSRLVALSPAASQALIASGLDIAALPQVHDLRLLGGDQHLPVLTSCEEDAQAFLTRLFRDRWEGPRALTPGGTIVRESGLLTETDLIAAYLSSEQSSLQPGPVARGLLSQSGFIEFGLVSPEGDALLESAEARLRTIGYIDPAHFRYQYVLFLDDAGKLRVRPFGAGSAGRLDEPGVPEGLFEFRSGLVQPASASCPFSPEVIEELESLVHSSATREHDYQVFFERNPRFLAGLEYGRVYPHPILYKDDGTTLIPDFFLEKLDMRGHAILDLKTTGHLAIRKRNRVYFSQWVQEGIAQLRYYRDWFEDRGNRETFMKALGLNEAVFRPRLVLVGGRRADYEDEVERLRLLSGQEGAFELWTYDDLLDRARRYRRFLAGAL